MVLIGSWQPNEFCLSLVFPMCFCNNFCLLAEIWKKQEKLLWDWNVILLCCLGIQEVEKSTQFRVFIWWIMVIKIKGLNGCIPILPLITFDNHNLLSTMRGRMGNAPIGCPLDVCFFSIFFPNVSWIHCGIFRWISSLRSVEVHLSKRFWFGRQILTLPLKLLWELLKITILSVHPPL